MRALLQRVNQASVSIEGKKISEIQKGILIFLGITHGDNEKDIQYLIDKIINVRIFEGGNGKLDLSVQDIQGELLVVSQFTLYGECEKGRRPDFGKAAKIEEAKKIYEKAVTMFQNVPLKTAFGEFQADMDIELSNDGPFTLLLESKK